MAQLNQTNYPQDTINDDDYLLGADDATNVTSTFTFRSILTWIQANIAIPIARVTGLQTAINGKANTTHTHTISDVTGLQTSIDGKANTSHTHTSNQITDFDPAVDTALGINTSTGSNDMVLAQDGSFVSRTLASGTVNPTTNAIPIKNSSGGFDDSNITNTFTGTNITSNRVNTTQISIFGDAGGTFTPTKSNNVVTIPLNRQQSINVLSRGQLNEVLNADPRGYSIDTFQGGSFGQTVGGVEILASNITAIDATIDSNDNAGGIADMLMTFIITLNVNPDLATLDLTKFTVNWDSNAGTYINNDLSLAFGALRDASRIEGFAIEMQGNIASTDGKMTSVATVASDHDRTLTTKDYVDAKGFTATTATDGTEYVPTSGTTQADLIIAAFNFGAAAEARFSEAGLITFINNATSTINQVKFMVGGVETTVHADDPRVSQFSFTVVGTNAVLTFVNLGIPGVFFSISNTILSSISYGAVFGTSEGPNNVSLDRMLSENVKTERLSTGYLEVTGNSDTNSNRGSIIAVGDISTAGTVRSRATLSSDRSTVLTTKGYIDTNAVSVGTTQTITGQKTFNRALYSTNGISFGGDVDSFTVLSGGSATAPGTSTIDLALTNTDLTLLRSLPSSTYSISFSSTLVEDASGNNVVPVFASNTFPIGTTLPAIQSATTATTPDTTEAILTGGGIDLVAGTLRLTFDEPVNVFSFDPTALTLHFVRTVFNTSNTLDDYEEGTWTPVISGLEAQNVNSITGNYVKIGNTVTLTMSFVADFPSAAFPLVTGAPFSPIDTFPITIIYTNNANANATDFFGTIGTTGGTISFILVAPSNATVGSTFKISTTYITNS